MINTDGSLALSDYDERQPVIGIDRKLTAIAATSEAAGFPASNLLNPLTHLLWRASSAVAQTLTLTTSGICDYVGIAKHNLLSSGSRIALRASASALFPTFLFHFDGADGSTLFVDSSGNDLGIQAFGTGGQIDTAQSKFGGASLLCNGSGGRAHATWVAVGNNDFTLDFWVRWNSTPAAARTLFDSRTIGLTGEGFAIYRASDNSIRYFANGADRIQGGGIGTGQWYHIGVARSGSNTKLFLDGTQIGSTYTTLDNFTTAGFFTFGANTDGSNPFDGWIDEARLVIGTAAWTANFTPPTSAYDDGPRNIGGAYELLLAFDGADGSTTITDTGGRGHEFTAAGGAQLDTAQSIDGGSSLLANGGYLLGDGSEDFAFGDQDFTISVWVRITSLATSNIIYDDRPLGTINYTGMAIYVDTAGKVKCFVSNSDILTAVNSITTNIWTHILVARSGTTTRLYVNGNQEASVTDNTVYLNGGESRPMIAGYAVTEANAFAGWIDQLLVIKGVALRTNSNNFVYSQTPISSLLGYGKGLFSDDGTPIMFRFEGTSDTLYLSFAAGAEAAQAAVVYAGEYLLLERSIDINEEHTPINLGRRTMTVNGKSTSGSFLGRIVTGETRESHSVFKWFDPDWYRANLDPFIISAQELPFFYAWNPAEYPADVGFCWLTDDPVPMVDPVTRRVALELPMQGVA